ncbi:HD domain-containing protein [Saccharothrix syringae]|uniref:HD domain-containing protein n=1 Tax=Saccharothrix syringae TaxID=103733 RepID=A0A5Q0GRT9_SACSY|nr:HD domain-containing protein [Saccharothrix syringae]QFZ16591.1 HD domain-containing protein [Saccharothrix syringae]
MDYQASARLAASLLATELPRRWSHVQGVAKRAVSISSMFEAMDAEVLASAAILHDIGYSRRISKTNFHPLDGALYLASIGTSRRLCSLVANHTCAYREADLRGLSAELAEWDDEKTAVRDALWWADMTTTPDGLVTNVRERIEEIQARYGPGDLVSTFIQRATSELVDAVDRTEERLRAAGLGHLAK